MREILTIPGAAITGAAIGGAVGGLEKVMTDRGVSAEDATYYGVRINDGGVFVSADTSAAGVSPESVTDVLYRLGGHSASRSKIAV